MLDNNEILLNLLDNLLERAKQSRHRQLMVLAGTQQWCSENATRISQHLIHGPAKFNEASIWKHNAKKNVHILGTEYRAAIYDCYLGFDPDQFGALSGTLVGGGVLILLTPELQQWSQFDDPSYKKLAIYPYKTSEIEKRFIKRLTRLLTLDTEITLFEQNKPVDTQKPEKMFVQSMEAELFAEQQHVIDEIKHVVYGHRKRPLVIVSDRGRGKSSALGIAAAQLLKQGVENIVITAARPSACEKLFEHAQKVLPDAVFRHACLQYQEKNMRFIAPDELFLNPVKASLLIVDEAAAIPTHILNKLLSQYSRIVFSTTVHGYEGTGRGFFYRFFKTLDKETPGWQMRKLHTPIRWAENDPLEKFTYRALLLDAMPADAAKMENVDAENFVYTCLDRNELLNDENLLSEIFGLLVNAHYRTMPSDLRSLMDSPNLSVHVLRSGQHVAATAMVVEEGALDVDLKNAIYRGERRVQGHLMPQSICFHEGIEDAVLLRCARIMRIAVHPALQRRGLGRKLIDDMLNQFKQASTDYLGASFGASAELLAFWNALDMKPVRIGLTRDHASGEYSVFVMRPLTREGQSLFKELRQRHSELFPQLLSEPLRDLDPLLVSGLMADTSRFTPTLAQWKDLMSFAVSARGYEVNMHLLHRLVCDSFHQQGNAESLEPRQVQVMVMKVLQHRTWQEIAHALDLAGKESVVALLRTAIAHILEMRLDEKTRRKLAEQGLSLG